MTEDEARAVVLLQALEAQPPSALWTAEDRQWATRAAPQDLGADATRGERLAARARVALQRLAARDRGIRRLLDARAWQPAWAGLALAIGLLAGLASDALVGGAYFNLLSLHFWALIAWNLALFLWLAAASIRHTGGGGRSRRALARLLVRATRAASLPAGFAARWAQAGAALSAARAALLLHLAAAGLALGLIAGLALRGLVLDYRAGWASTLLGPDTVRDVLALALQPALALSGSTLPADFEALRVTPGQPAAASAAPWMGWMALQLLLVVVLPRLLLAAWAGWRARRLALDFPLDTQAPAFDRWLPAAAGTLWVLPHGAAPAPAAAAGLRAMLAAGFGSEAALHWADPLPWGEEDRVPTPPPGARALLLVDLAATPEAEVHGRLLQALAASDPLIVAERSGFVRRFGAGERLAQREAAWRALAGERVFVSAALADPDPAAAVQALQAALAAG